MTTSKWDKRMLDLAAHIAQWSHDPSTKVGCVITQGKNDIRSMGYNGLPAGVDDSDARLHDRETKLRIVQHAEMNAVTRAREPLTGATAYVWPIPPCPSCTGVLANAGISRVVTRALSDDHKHRARDLELSMELFAEAGIEVDFLD